MSALPPKADIGTGTCFTFDATIPAAWRYSPQPAARLRRLFNLQPAGKGIPKLIAQIGDLVGRHRIGMGLQQGLKCVVDQFEIDLAQFVFFPFGGTPDKAASVVWSPLTVPLFRLTQQLRQLGDIGRNPPRLIAGERVGGRSVAPARPRNRHRPAFARRYRSRQSTLLIHNRPGRREAARG